MTWGLLALCALLLLALAIEAPGIVRSMGLNADLSAPLAMAEFAHRYDGAQLVTGRLGWWEGLWFLQGIRTMPGSRLIAEWLPLLATVAVGGGVALQARRLWGTRAAAVCGLVILSVSGGVWVFQSSWSGRSPTWLAMGLLALVVVGFAGQVERRSPLRAGLLGLAGLVVAIHAGLVLSGDSLAVPAVVLPLLASTLAFALMRRWLLVATTGAIGGVVLLVYALAKSEAASRGYLLQDYPLEFIKSDALIKGLDNALGGVVRLWQGSEGFGTAFGNMAFLGVVGGLVGAAMAITVCVVAGRYLLQHWDKRREEAWSVVTDPVDAERTIWTVYWLTAVLGLVVAYWLTSATDVDDAVVGRYLYGVPLAVGALAALAVGVGRPRMSVLVTSSAVVVAIVALAGFIRIPPGREVSAEAEEVVRIAKEEGITRGYAGYWASYPLSYASDFDLEVTPVGECGGPNVERLCAMFLHYIDQAYAPREGRSFLVLDKRAGIALGNPASQATKLPSNMRPDEVHEVSPEVTVYVFDHDIARELQGNAGLNDPRIGHGGPLPPR